MSADRPRAERCSVLSLAAGESLHATATHATEWLLIEVPGPWGRDVGGGEGLPPGAQEAVLGWREGGGSEDRRRVLFIRRPGRASGPLLAFRVVATEGRGEVRRIAVDEHAEIAHVDLEAGGELVETRLVLACGHGSRDRCCAPAGAAVLGALAELLGEEELWISSHQGGHRFAANVLVLPPGIQLGRVDPAVARGVVGRALAGEIDLDHYRGRTYYAPAVQAAEHAIRVASGLTRARDLRLQRRTGHDSGISFRDADGQLHEAVVEQATGPAVPASCGAPAEPQPRFTGTLVG